MSQKKCVLYDYSPPKKSGGGGEGEGGWLRKTLLKISRSDGRFLLSFKKLKHNVCVAKTLPVLKSIEDTQGEAWHTGMAFYFATGD